MLKVVVMSYPVWFPWPLGHQVCTVALLRRKETKTKKQLEAKVTTTCVKLGMCLTITTVHPVGDFQTHKWQLGPSVEGDKMGSSQGHPSPQHQNCTGETHPITGALESRKFLPFLPPAPPPTHGLGGKSAEEPVRDSSWSEQKQPEQRLLESQRILRFGLDFLCSGLIGCLLQPSPSPSLILTSYLLVCSTPSLLVCSSPSLTLYLSGLFEL